MLVEILLTGSCSLDAAALGICECSDSNPEGTFQVCATERITGREESTAGPPTPPIPKPMRLCSWYANGTIDTPTLTIITAWIPVGSRLCIGDEVREAQPRVVTITDEVSDSFGATSNRPLASWTPGSEVEVGVAAGFSVQLAPGEFRGVLLGRQAWIRFEPVSARWSFSDGDGYSGFRVERVFDQAGEILATADVKVRASYRFDGGSWQESDAEIWLSSNQLRVSVVEIPRRTLLVSR